MRAKAYQEHVKRERMLEEQRIEDEFKEQMLKKFAEDDRIEQMNAQKRRMKELEHKKEVERLWQEKLEMYKKQREMEIAEREAAELEERKKRDIIEQEKAKLLEEYGSLLKEYHPKAST